MYLHNQYEIEINSNEMGLHFVVRNHHKTGTVSIPYSFDQRCNAKATIYNSQQ